MQTESRTCQACLSNYAEMQLTLSKGSTSPLSMQANFVNASIYFAVVLPLLHNDDAKQMQIESRTCQACLGNYAEMQLCLSKVISILPHSPIWFVSSPLWFVTAAFCTSKHPTTVKTPVKSSLFSPNTCTTQINAVPLQQQNPPRFPLDQRTRAGLLLLYLWLEYIQNSRYLSQNR